MDTKTLYAEAYRLARIDVQIHIARSIWPAKSNIIEAAYDSYYHKKDHLRVTTQFQFGIFCGRYTPVPTAITMLSKWKPDWGMGFINSHRLTDYKMLRRGED